MRRQGKARQGETRQGEAKYGKTRQDKARQDKTRQDTTRQGIARQHNTRRDKMRQDETRQHKKKHKTRRVQTLSFPCLDMYGIKTRTSVRCDATHTPLVGMECGPVVINEAVAKMGGLDLVILNHVVTTGGRAKTNTSHTHQSYHVSFHLSCRCLVLSWPCCCCYLVLSCLVLPFFVLWLCCDGLVFLVLSCPYRCLCLCLRLRVGVGVFVLCLVTVFVYVYIFVFAFLFVFIFVLVRLFVLS